MRVKKEVHAKEFDRGLRDFFFGGGSVRKRGISRQKAQLQGVVGNNCFGGLWGGKKSLPRKHAKTWRPGLFSPKCQREESNKPETLRGMKSNLAKGDLFCTWTCGSLRKGGVPGGTITGNPTIGIAFRWERCQKGKLMV